MSVTHRFSRSRQLLYAALVCLASSCVEPGDDTGSGLPAPSVNDTVSGGTRDTAANSQDTPPSSGPPDGGSNVTDAAQADVAPEVLVDPPIGPPPAGGKCDYVAIAQEAGKAFGEGCEKNADCAWGECLEPSEGGNITNEVFGFCTRACDCGTTETQLTPEQKPGLMCIYPPGNQRKWSHVVVRCGSVADCIALDPRWTACRLPSAGGLQAVCHADKP